MKTLKTVLTVIGIVVLGGGIYYGVMKYFPSVVPEVDTPTDKTDEDIMLAEESVFTQFPADMQAVIQVDFSPENQSAKNYKLIKERYPILDEMEEAFTGGITQSYQGAQEKARAAIEMAEMDDKDTEDDTDKNEETTEESAPSSPFLEPLRDDLDITMADLWETIDGNVTLGIAFHDENTYPDFMMTIETNNTEPWIKLFTTEGENNEEYVVVKLTDNLYYNDIRAEMEAQGEEFIPSKMPERVFFTFKDNTVTLSSYDLGTTPEESLADNNAFKKHWEALPEGSIVSVYADESIIPKILEFSNPSIDTEALKIISQESFTNMAMALMIMPDEIVGVRVSTPRPDSVFYSAFKGEEEMPLHKYLPDDTLLIASQTNVGAYVNSLLELLKSNEDTMNLEDGEIEGTLEAFETMYGLNLEELFKVLFSKSTTFALVEVDNPLIPVSGILMNEVTNEEPIEEASAGSDNENVPTTTVKEVITALEDSIITIVSDDLVAPDLDVEFSFLDDKTADFAFRKFVPNEQFGIGMFHSLEIVDDVWVVATSEEGLQKIYDTKNATVDPLSANARYNEVEGRIQHDNYVSYVFVDLYRMYRMLRPVIGAGMSEEEFTFFQEKVDPYLEKLHSIYGYTAIQEDGMIYEKGGLIFE